MFSIANIALGVTTGFSAIKYVNLGYKKFIAPLIPQKAKEFTKQIISSTDNGSIGKSINKGLQSFAAKYPAITKTLGILGKWTLPILSLGCIASIAFDACKANSKQQKTLDTLKSARLQAAQQLAAKNINSSEQA